MNNDEDWDAFLDGHPVLSAKLSAEAKSEVELSLRSVQEREDNAAKHDGPIPSRRRQVVVIKDSDLIVAAGSEIRIASLVEDGFPTASAGASEGKSYKVCATFCNTRPPFPISRLFTLRTFSRSLLGGVLVAGKLKTFSITRTVSLITFLHCRF